MIRRILSVAVKEFIHLRRDWWLPAFMLIGGISELLLIGWATSRPITNLPLVVFDQDRSAYSRTLTTAILNTGTFELQPAPATLDEIEMAMDRGEINAAVIIPPDYSTALASPDGTPEIAVMLNGAESVSASASLSAIEGVVRTLSEGIIIQRLGVPAGSFDGFAPGLRVWFNENLKESLYTTPAELGLMLEFTILLFAALSFSRERELGTLEQLLVMPFSSLEIIIGKAIPVVLIGFLDFVLMLGMVHLVFDVPIRGSLLLLLVLAFGYLLVELGKGMVISVVSRTQHQAFLLVMLLGMTDFMFTGYAAPVESMPQAIQWFANVIPAHHWLDILRGILLKGAGLDVLWPSILALAILGALIGSFSLYYVRRALN